MLRNGSLCNAWLLKKEDSAMGASQSSTLAAALEKLAAEVRSAGGDEVQMRALLPRFK